MASTPNVIDLFCGCGGLSLGFTNAGFATTRAHDSWKAAVDTYNANFNHSATGALISEDLELPRADVIVGGPPCQGFSSAGMRRADDHRNTLVRTFSQIVASQRPRAFVFENVEGFLTGARGAYVFELLEPLIEAGYRVHVRKINAANYGVPQHRKRVVAIGGLGWDPSFPAPTHAAFGAPGAQLANTRGLPTTPTVAEALRGLARPRKSDGNLESGLDHVFQAMSQEDLDRARLLEPGQCMRDLPRNLWHESYRRRAFRRVMDGTPTERRGGAPAGLRRLRPDEPSKTITGGALGEFLHPTLDRPLTVRECARLQTFPDNFSFVGRIRDAIQLIGNAVPPRLALIIGTSLRADLEEHRTTRKRGKLLSFVPTLSIGMSPVLRDVCQRVASRFGLEEQLQLWP